MLYLRFGQAIPFERLARLLRDLFGLEISEGALANLLQDSAPALTAQTSLIKQRLLSSTVLASDETSVRVGKKTFWTWVFHHADSACAVVGDLAVAGVLWCVGYFVEQAVQDGRGRQLEARGTGLVRPEVTHPDRAVPG